MNNIDFLKDSSFLQALDESNLKIQYVKIILLSFDEKPIKEIQGVVQNGGAIQVNGASALRRTISFTMFADINTNDLTNIDNLISLNKKIKIYIGYRNLLPQYQRYGEIVWFKGGTYVITQASITNSANGSTINIQGKDKMVKLNGTIGGVIPSAIILHERQEYLKDGTIVITYPTLFQIIQEVVTEYGEENINNIVISDLDLTAKALIKYIGDKTLYVKKDNSEITEDLPEDIENYNVYSYGQNIGYEETDFTFPGKLEFAAGSTVTQVLDKIISVLGNFEYFYDLDGKFIFREKRNYLNTAYSPLVELNGEQYIYQFSNSKYMYTFNNMKTVTTINNSPKYENIKNDFMVWGKRTTPAGQTIPIRFHLALDTKPQINLANKYMWEVRSLEKITKETKDEEGKVTSSKTVLALGELLRYEFSDTEDAYEQYEEKNSQSNQTIGYNLIGKPSLEWREELFRQCLLRQKDGIQEDYDMELSTEWRKLYDTMNEDWYKSEQKSAWNPKVYTDPQSLDYWLEFLDGNDSMRKYSVKAIGKRNKTVNKDSITSIFNSEVPDLLYVNSDFKNDTERSKVLNKLNSSGQSYLLYSPQQKDLFSISSTGISAYDEIRELLYNHMNYNCQVSITCLSKPYLEPNNLIYIANTGNGVYGKFIVSSFNIPLNHEGQMTIQATEALERI